MARTKASFVAAALASAAVVVLAGGCGDSGGSSPEPSGDSLSAAMADAHTASEGVDEGTGPQPFYFSWVDTARLRDVAGLPASSKQAITDERWQTPVGYAVGDRLADQIVATDFGFDPFTGDRTITVGQPPEAVTRYDGVDTGGVEDAFEKFGYERRGDFLALGDEGEIVQDALDENGLGPIGLNRVETDGDSLALGAYESPVEAALGKAGDPVLGTEGAGAVADCLGDDALAAIVVDPEGAAADDVSLIGVGISSDGSSEAVKELLCAAGEDGGSIDDVADCMDTQFNEGGTDPATNLEYSENLGDGDVETGDSDGTPWAKASFSPPDPKAPVGLVFQILQQSGFAGPLGGDPALSAAGTTATPEQIEQIREQGCGGATS